MPTDAPASTEPASTTPACIYMVNHYIDDKDGRSFVGMFTTFEKAKEVVEMCPQVDGYLVISMIDINKIYFTLDTEIGVIVFVKQATDTSSKIMGTENLSQEFKDMLHEDNDLDGYLESMAMETE